MTVERIELLGEYQTPAFQVGDMVECAMRGTVKVVGVTAGRIPWPTAKRVTGRKSATPAIVLYDCLIDAVQNESNCAICHWWGVTGQTVSQWRKALGIGRSNPGTSRLHAEHYREHVGEAMRKALLPAVRSPERRAKISAAKLGKPRPDLSERNRSRLGAKLSAESRAVFAGHRFPKSPNTIRNHWARYRRAVQSRFLRALVACDCVTTSLR